MNNWGSDHHIFEGLSNQLNSLFSTLLGSIGALETFTGGLPGSASAHHPEAMVLYLLSLFRYWFKIAPRSSSRNPFIVVNKLSLSIMRFSSSSVEAFLVFSL